MKKYSKFLFIAGISAMSLTSCNLDLEPTDAIHGEVTDTLIQNITMLQSYANGVNDGYRGAFYGSLSLCQEVMLDGFNAMQGYGNNLGPIHRMDASFTSSDQSTISTWSTYYGALVDINTFIDQVEKFNKKFANNPSYLAAGKIYEAYAHFYRANAYLELVRHFGKAYESDAAASKNLGVPIVLEYNLDAKPARATVKEVYDQIKKDLDIAKVGIDMKESADKKVLKLVGITTKAQFRMTPTADGLKALMARYYLDTKQFDKAAALSKEIIDGGKYTLASNMEEMQNEYTYDKGTEAIMVLPGSVNESGASTNSYFTRIETNDILVKKFKFPTPMYYSPYYAPSLTLIKLYKSSDLRFQAWFDKRNYPIITENSDYNGMYVFSKYVGNPDLTSNGILNGRHLIKPFMISEMYLINAEANCKAGNVSAAKDILNKLQAARGADLTGATIEEIGDEYFRELVGEGARYNFLKRNHMGTKTRPCQPEAITKNMVVQGPGYEDHKLSADDYHWTWPIPAREMQINKNLKQNEGYGE